MDIQKQHENLAEKYFSNSTYRPYLEAMEKSPLAKVRPIGAYDHYALGMQLEQFDLYKQMCEEDGNIGNLGKIPHIAYDVITATYGASPLNVIASTQPTAEEQGSVYFKDVVADSDRGGLTQGQAIFSPDQQTGNILNGFAGDTVDEIVAQTAATVTSYNVTSSNVPLRPYLVKVTIDLGGGNVLEAVDNGEGRLLGFDIQGTVDYTTGAIALTLANDPAGVFDIVVTSSMNFEAAGDIPRIRTQFRSKPFRSRIWALKDTIGMEQAYAMKRRFGLIAEDEMTQDLTAAINSELVNTGIRLMNAAAVGNTQFAVTPPSAVSEFEHRQSFKYRIADAEAKLLANANRGVINVMIAGSNAAALLSTLPGFEKVSSGDTVGPHIYGTLDGVTIVRVHNAQILDPNTILCTFRGTSPFDAGLAWAPYMPLVVTTALPTGTNPLTNQKAAAVWGGLEVVIKNFVTKITLV